MQSTTLLPRMQKSQSKLLSKITSMNHRITWGLTVNGALFTPIAVGYTVAKDNLTSKDDLIFVVLSFLILASIAIWVSYITVRGIVLARMEAPWTSSGSANTIEGNFN
jgi:mannose/fructose/N-acetylgalactosamine-specific phosphotransferase system component IIC